MSLAKSQVNYRPAGQSPRRCGTCEMFAAGRCLKPDGSAFVAGPIRAEDVCDRWEKKDAESRAKT